VAARWRVRPFAQLTGVLRRLLRQREGKEAEPSACVIDAQSIKTSTSVPAAGQGTDAAKKIVGRKRSIVTDTLGLLLTVPVTAASVQDSVAGTHLGIDMEIVQRAPGTRGFTPLPKRWTVERTYGWLMSTAAWPATTKRSPPAPKP
jgi:hypothetical protein